MKKIFTKLTDLLRYPSTYKGATALLAAFGIALSPEQSEAIASAGLAIYGVISVFFSDSDVKERK